MSCRVCHAGRNDGDRFCEQCGAPFVEDELRSEDRTEVDLTIAAAVSDRGRVHERNEDSFFAEVIGEGTVAVVLCDGVSAASAGNIAARSAASTAGAALKTAMADHAQDPTTATIEAIQAARGAVEQVEWTTRVGRVDPSCTIVSALCKEGEIVVGWVGDSRAYWVDSDSAHQLTIDDSLAEEGIAQGLLTTEQAARSPFRHSITHWVGPASPERPPRFVVLRPDRPGRLVLCTDGMWNYAATAAELRELVQAQPPDASALALARALADTALARGGRDNITVAVVDIDPRSDTRPER